MPYQKERPDTLFWQEGEKETSELYPARQCWVKKRKGQVCQGAWNP